MSDTDSRYADGETIEYIKNLEAENASLKEDYLRACGTVAEMHCAAVGEMTGPKRGVVEDVADIRAQLISTQSALEREQMRLAACGVVAMADTPDSAAKVRDMHPDYRSASCDDIARRVDECISLRRQRDELLAALGRVLLCDIAEVRTIPESCGAIHAARAAIAKSKP